ncbi:MAG: hypothetical protein GWO41_01780, partial [candidate division Zixibacteria bacterium]|nr:hypothetical protein [candidate division Zixibacteria bacterium]NIR65315.1 hypothetical protein [candidate division Zixibacteria bacterium]NIS14971.1 hypothetical protein [candidate division Zixibacteria bacterium]NIS45109.1 hypothetical protein [candidate division Zixibacteria bacterium]NIT51497.1 hypothetical protein [candidate division Zixibacteria bacterium]
MKRSLFLTFLMLLLTFGFATAANRIMVAPYGDIAPDTLNNAGLTGATVTFQFENDQVIVGFSNGLAVSATGSVTATVVNGSGNYVSGSRFEPIFNVQGMPWNWYYAATDDTIGFGGAWTPPTTFPGFEPGGLADAGFFELDIAVPGAGLGDTGTIFIDSTIKFGQAGDWLWDGWDGTSQPPDITPLNPTFNDGAGAFATYVAFIPCQAPQFTSTPTGDVLTVPHCDGGSFQFNAIPVQDGETLTGYAVVDDGGLTNASITNGGLFTFDGGDPGDYTVTVSVSNSCPATTEYTFTVTLSNAGLQYTSCPTGALEFEFSQNKTVTVDLGLDNFDCDPITETVTDPGVTNPPSVSGGVFTWENNGDIGTWTFTVTAGDGFGETATCDITITVLEGSLLGVRIAKIGDPPDPFVFQGT